MVLMGRWTFDERDFFGRDSVVILIGLSVPYLGAPKLRSTEVGRKILAVLRGESKFLALGRIGTIDCKITTGGRLSRLPGFGFAGVLSWWSTMNDGRCFLGGD